MNQIQTQRRSRAKPHKASAGSLEILARLAIAPIAPQAVGYWDGTTFNSLIDNGYAIYGRIGGKLCYSITNKGLAALAAGKAS